MNTTMLSDAKISDLCGQHLEALSTFVAQKKGREAADHTGICLLKALRSYDEVKSPDLMVWLKYKVPLLVVEEIRAFEGRKGTAKHAAMSATSGLEDYDAADTFDGPGDAAGGREQLQEALKAIESAGKLARLILIGRFFGNFSNKEIGHLTNVERTQIHREAAHLSQFLSPDRLPAAVRRKHRRTAIR